MKKIITVFLISVLLLSTLPLTANANTTVDYDAMAEYDGFAKAVYDSYVTNTTYIAGKYTNNLDYVNETIQEIKHNANALWDGFKNEQCTANNDCNWGWEFIKKLLAGGATAIDFIKNFFNAESDNHSGVNPSEFYSQYMYVTGTTLIANEGYVFNVSTLNDIYERVTHIRYAENLATQQTYFNLTSNYNYSLNVSVGYQPLIRPVPPLNINTFYTYTASQGIGITVILTNDSNQVPIKPPTSDNYTQINNYIQNNNSGVHPNYNPAIQTKLICPNTTIDVQIQGTDLIANGQSLIVNKQTGQTTYNNEECIVSFSSVIPTITDDNRLVIDNDDGTFTDIETNDRLDEQGNILVPEFNGNPDNCDGVLCFLSTLVKSIGGMVSAIVNAITGLIDMLFHLIVPENLDFITDLFDTLKTTFTEKFAITTDIQNLFKSIFTESTTNPLTDLSFTLPATDTELSFRVFAVVDDYVPMIKRIISALLALMTLMYVYRKITGSGGVMEK